jgi:hypothetical protein
MESDAIEFDPARHALAERPQKISTVHSMLAYNRLTPRLSFILTHPHLPHLGPASSWQAEQRTSLFVVKNCKEYS